MINDNDDDPPPGSFSRTHPTSDAPRNVRHPLSSFNSKCPNIPRPTGGGCGIREFEIRTLRPSQSARTRTTSPVRDHLARSRRRSEILPHASSAFIHQSSARRDDRRAGKRGTKNERRLVLFLFVASHAERQRKGRTIQFPTRALEKKNREFHPLAAKQRSR